MSISPFFLGILYSLGDTHYKGPLYWLSPITALLSRVATGLGIERRLLRKILRNLVASAP